MHHPIDRIAHTTAFVTPLVEHWLEREIAQWVHPMKDNNKNNNNNNNNNKKNNNNNKRNKLSLTSMAQ